MEKLDRRHALQIIGAATAGLFLDTSPNLAIAAPDELDERTKQFAQAVNDRGGFNNLGYMLTKATPLNTDEWVVTLQGAQMIQDQSGNFRLNNVLDETDRALETSLENGELGVTVPKMQQCDIHPSEPNAFFKRTDFFRIPDEVTQKALELKAIGLDPGVPTSSGKDFDGYFGYRYENMSFQSWQNTKLVERQMIGDALLRANLVSQDAILDVPLKTDIVSQFLPRGCNYTGQVWTGVASHYTRAGCLGCNGALRMSNGETLDDNKTTLAFMQAPLNRLVEVTNPVTGLSVVAKITDRGGFEARGWIADLSLATKNAIGGGDLTGVKITLLSC